MHDLSFAHCRQAGRPGSAESTKSTGATGTGSCSCGSAGRDESAIRTAAPECPERTGGPERTGAVETEQESGGRGWDQAGSERKEAETTSKERTSRHWFESKHG